VVLMHALLEKGGCVAYSAYTATTSSGPAPNLISRSHWCYLGPVQKTDYHVLQVAREGGSFRYPVVGVKT